VQFETSDGVTIHASYYDPNKSNATPVILLHMLSRNRNDWNDFAKLLQSNGYAVLSIDLRGHGQSTSKSGKTINWQQFTDRDFNDMKLDIEAAKNFLLHQPTVNKNKLVIIGASIGANLALSYSINDKDIKGITLLSPGVNYRGVTTTDKIKRYNNSVLLVASEDDSQSVDATKLLYAMATGDKQLKIYQNAGHGTRMFSGTDLDKIILNWLKKI